LKQMGVETVGDRKRVMDAIATLKKAKAIKEREKVLWTGIEIRFVSCWEWCCETCCGCCPQDAEEYTLRSNHLEIKKPNLVRIVKQRGQWLECGNPHVE
jgi:hypothetical protein